MAAEYGFVYFLSNESMPGIYKIGFTMNHPKARMEQLSSATACPTPFEILACFGCEDPRAVEAEIHRELSIHRINASREFFCLPFEKLQEIYRQYSDEVGDLGNSFELDWQVKKEVASEMVSWKVRYFNSQCADPIHWPKPSRRFEEIPF